MNTKRKTKKPVYVIRGVAIDQEAIIRQRPMIEDYVRESMHKKFRKTSVNWDMNKEGNFDFTVEFYA